MTPAFKTGPMLFAGAINHLVKVSVYLIWQNVAGAQVKAWLLCRPSQGQAAWKMTTVFFSAGEQMSSVLKIWLRGSAVVEGHPSCFCPLLSLHYLLMLVWRPAVSVTEIKPGWPAKEGLGGGKRPKSSVFSHHTWKMTGCNLALWLDRSDFNSEKSRSSILL